MENRHGDFIWYELMTPDPAAAQAFYGGLLGWTFEDASPPEATYIMFSGSAGQVGGMLGLTGEMTQGGARPAWLGYVGVDSLDAALEGLKTAGGAIVFGPGEVPDVGPFAMVTDPQGTPFYLIEDRSGKTSSAFAAEEPLEGHCAWNELMAADATAAKAFYGQQYGWVVADTMDMGPMGAYEIMKNGADRSFAFGAIMKKPDEMPVSLWSYYFRVPDIDRAVEYIGGNGAQVINGPIEIPGGEFALSGLDPHGAMFSLVGPRNG